MGRTACTEPQCLYKGDLYLTFYCEFYTYISCKFARRITFLTRYLSAYLNPYPANVEYRVSF